MPDAKDQNLTRDENPKAGRWGRACEVLSAAAFAFGVVLLWYGARSSDILLVSVSAILFVICVLSFLAAWRSSSNADFEVARRRYLISEHRINTLKQVKAPDDVTSFLLTIQGWYPLRERQLLGELRTALGSERTNEVKNLVMKYTQIDRKDAAELLKQRRNFPPALKHRQSEKH